MLLLMFWNLVLSCNNNRVKLLWAYQASTEGNHFDRKKRLAIYTDNVIYMKTSTPYNTFVSIKDCLVSLIYECTIENGMLEYFHFFA